MTAFGKLIRTTAFRLTLVYLFLFALFAASLLGYFAWNTRRLITEQITSTVNAETSEISEISGVSAMEERVMAGPFREKGRPAPLRSAAPPIADNGRKAEKLPCLAAHASGVRRRP